MSKSKIVGIMALIAFAMGILLVENALAGEKFKLRAIWYNIKFEPVNVPGEEGRILFPLEQKGILTVFQGSKLLDGMASFCVAVGDLNTKTGPGSGHGVIECTDRDGDKIYWTWEGKAVKGLWSGPMTVVRGTGKFEGLKGKATWSTVPVAPNQSYVDWEGDMDLPR